MAKKFIVIAAIIIVIAVVAGIIISLINLKPLEFKTVVSYENDTVVMKVAPSNNTNTNNTTNNNFLTNILRHEKTVMAFSIIVIVLFALLFYEAKGSKA